MGSSKFHTKNYAAGETLIISEDNSVMQVSIKVLTGTCQFTGNARFGSSESEPVQLGTGDPVVLTAYGPNAPIVGVTITPDGGSTVRVILHF